MSRIRIVVLVEGASDQAALEALAARRGRSLVTEGVAIRPMGGATSLSRHLSELSSDVAIAGLCDEAEESDFRNALQQAGRGSNLTRRDMERLGFFVCVRDLEDELIRSTGTDTVEAIIHREGELRSLRTLQYQPAWRDQPTVDQLRRFISSRSGRKLRYGRLLAAATQVTPPPLDGVLAFTSDAVRP